MQAHGRAQDSPMGSLASKAGRPGWEKRKKVFLALVSTMATI